MDIVVQSLTPDRTEMLKALYKTSAPAAKILVHFANRRKDRKTVEVDRLQEILPDVARGEIIDVLKKLDDLKIGRFLVGRRGAVSRFEWDFSLRSVGKAAMGEGTVEPVAAEFDEGEEAQPSAVIRHEYRLRSDFAAHIELPADLTAREANRLADFVKTLPFVD